MAATARIGVLGGTFDPPHNGHLAAAAAARWHLDLDVVLLVVANRPWQKEGDRSISDAGARLAMVAALVAGVDGLSASDLEIRRGGVSYTADTLDELRRLHPDREVCLILGRDAAAGLPTWERVDEVQAGAAIVVVDRPGAEAPLPPGWAFERIDVPALQISSSDLRDRVAQGRPLAGLTPPAVMTEIERLGLYR